jgi:hypothetical protein
MQKEKPTMANPTEKFLATMFSGGGHASQDSGLLIGSSTDGVTFRNIGGNSKPVYKPTNGVRDPIILYWQRQWYLVSSYGPSILPLLSIAKSPDLLHWTPLGSLRLSADTANNFVDVPQWIVDPSGNVHIIACVDQNHHWVELHPLSPDPAMWGDQKNWSPVTTMTDQNGEPLVQGNSFVALRNGTYYMAFNDIDASVYYLRTSAHLTSGWSAARQLNLDSSVNKGDSENLVFLSDGSLRFYISNGNSLTKVMWHADSADLGVNWTSPEVVTFEGFGPQEINWAQIVRITEPAAIAAIVAANEQTGVWTRRNENAAEQRPEPYR